MGDDHDGAPRCGGDLQLRTQRLRLGFVLTKRRFVNNDKFSVAGDGTCDGEPPLFAYAKAKGVPCQKGGDTKCLSYLSYF